MNNYRNKEELYFSYYLDELKEMGIIENYFYETLTFILSDKVTFEYIKSTQLKTKLKIEDKIKTLLQPCTYNMDFVIEGFNCPNSFASDKLADFPIFILSQYEDTLKAFIDVKGEFAGRTNTTQYTFPLKQKWLYQDYGIYTNKIIPYKLFEETFTPYKVIQEEVYKKNNKKREIKIGDSKLKYSPIRIKKWYESI